MLLAEYETIWMLLNIASLAIGLAAGEQAGPIGMLNIILKCSKL